jgi:DNA-binding NarL/FixJ family response regulator
MTGLRVVLADDDVLLREGLASLLERSGVHVVGRAGEAPHLLALVRETRPDLAVVDIRMPPTRTTEGLEAARVIRRELPEVAILAAQIDAKLDRRQGMDAMAEALALYGQAIVTAHRAVFHA